MSDWLAIIQKIAPKARPAIARGLADAMAEIVSTYEVNTPLRQAHFIAQCAHESDGFRTACEYASGAAYEGRKDLGNTKKGDGKRFKGRGLIQTTGRKNYAKAATVLGVDFLAEPERLEAFPFAALSAAVFWRNAGLNKLADTDDVRAVTKRVNGGFNGLAERTTYLARAKTALDVDHEHQEGPEPLPRAKVVDLQKKLSEGGYDVGAADGKIGGRTRGVIVSFQESNGLPVSGNFDPATVEAIEAGFEPRPIPQERAEGKPDGSRILGGATKIKAAAGGLAGVSATKLVADPVGAIEGASGQYGRLQAALAPFQGLLDWASAHWPILAIAGAVIVFFLAHEITKARVEDHRTGKTA